MTSVFQQLVERGILLVVDECQNVNNSTTRQTRALATLVGYIVDSGSRSRCVFLSSSPFNKMEQVHSFVQCIGRASPGPMLLGYPIEHFSHSPSPPPTLQHISARILCYAFGLPAEADTASSCLFLFSVALSSIFVLLRLHD